eukprot:3882408-Rhodomonas_salina.2
MVRAKPLNVMLLDVSGVETREYVQNFCRVHDNRESHPVVATVGGEAQHLISGFPFDIIRRREKNVHRRPVLGDVVYGVVVSRESVEHDRGPSAGTHGVPRVCNQDA